MMSVKACGLFVIGWLMGVGPLVAQTPEREPNNTPATATPAVRGSSGKGTIAGIPPGSENGDIDYWVLTVTAGDTIYADIDANEFGSPINTQLWLYASDGVTLLAHNADWDGMDPHLTYVATTAGNYFVAVESERFQWPTSDQPYTINFFEVKCPAAEDIEPNNSPATAMSVTLNQTIHGVSCPNPDRDFFKIAVTAGATVSLNLTTPPHERIAFGSANEIGGQLTLLAPDGTTILEQTSQERRPDSIEYTFATAGTYFVAASVWPGGLRYTYTLSIRFVAGPGPGDPITERAEIATYWQDNGGVVAANGDVLLTSWSLYAIRRITPLGAISDTPLAVDYPAGLALDAAGNLLIVNSGDAATYPTSVGGVFKLSPTGQLTRFITDARASMGIAVGRDGSIWVAAYSAKALLHYDEHGTLIAAHDVAAATADGPRHVALGPSGDPYFSTITDIYRLRSGHAERIIHYDRTLSSSSLDIGSFAFDAQGNIYVPNAAAGVVNLHDATGKWLETFSYGPTAPSRVFFGRNSDGSTNSRLYAIDYNKLIELNPAGVRAPGWPVQPQGSQEPTTAQAAAELLRPGSLSAAQRTQLDALGNQNGRYDVGDFRALLQRIGLLPTGARRP